MKNFMMIQRTQRKLFDRRRIDPSVHSSEFEVVATKKFFNEFVLPDIDFDE